MRKKVVCLLMTLLLLLSFPVSAMAEDGSEDSRDAVRQAVAPDPRDIYQEIKNRLNGSLDTSIMHSESTTDGEPVTAAAYEGDWGYYINDGGTATIADYRGTASSVITPTTLGGVTVTQIGTYAFSEQFTDNHTLVSVEISEGVKQLGDVEDEGILYGNVFEFCESLTSVKLPLSLEKLGFMSFMDCPSLATITVASGNTYFKVEGGILFSNDDGGTTFDVLEFYPTSQTAEDYTVPADIVKIAPFAIELNENIKSLSLPSSLRSCDDGVVNMPNLETLVVADGITRISGFINCPKLNKVSLPDSVDTYGWMLFGYCGKLTGFVRSTSNLKKIESQAFWQSGFTSVNIPATVETIGTGAYGCCLDLTSFNVSTSNTKYKHDNYGVLLSKDGTDLIMYPAGKTASSYSVPNTVATIWSYAFYASLLNQVSLPNSLQGIGDFAFDFGILSSVVIPQNVSSIGYSAFKYNDYLKKCIVYSNNVDYDDDVFYGSPYVVLYGNAGSTTQSYASDYGIPFGTITTSIRVSPSSARMVVGTLGMLDISTTPAGGYVTWSSNNPAVATVDADGVISAKAVGSVRITATSLDRSASCTIYVEALKPVGISCTKTDATVYGAANGSVTVSASGGNSGYYEYSLSNGTNWQDSNVFGGVAAGTYTATVRDPYVPENTATCSVSIGQPAYMGYVPAKKIASKVNAGNALTIVPPAPPKGYTVQSVTYSSSNPAIATVDAGGNVTFLAGGKVTIITKIVSQMVDKKGKVKTKTTTVKKSITVRQPVASISLNMTNTTIARTQKLKLGAAIAPSTASVKKLKWTSSNPKVAAVSSSGVVTGKAGGTAVITCTATDGSGKSASCTVNVTPIYPTGIKLSKAALTLKTGKTGSLKATIAPKNTDFKTVTWASSNPGVVTVDAKGKLKAVAPGTAVITATTSSGQSASCTVTVQ